MVVCREKSSSYKQSSGFALGPICNAIGSLLTPSLTNVSLKISVHPIQIAFVLFLKLIQSGKVLAVSYRKDGDELKRFSLVLR